MEVHEALSEEGALGRFSSVKVRLIEKGVQRPACFAQISELVHGPHNFQNDNCRKFTKPKQRTANAAGLCALF